MKNYSLSMLALTMFGLISVAQVNSNLNISGRLADGTLEPRVRQVQTYSGLLYKAGFASNWAVVNYIAACGTDTSKCRVGSSLNSHK